MCYTNFIPLPFTTMRANVKLEESLRFMRDCLKAAGANSKAAEDQAALLLEADRFGHQGHGLHRLEKDLNDIISGACTPNAEPKVLKETVSTAWVDANYVMGATSSHLAMDLAITKAKYSGVGWVVVKRANNNGLMSHWARKAAKDGFIGWCFSNSPPLIAPTRAKKAALGTNPMSLVAPATGGESFLLDITTAAVSMGKIEMKYRDGEKIPLGWALGPDGKETTDAAVALKTASLLPLGGSDETSGHKGFGLSAMVELFCGICAGSNYGHHMRPYDMAGGMPPADRGHCFAAIDIKRFAPGFGDRLAECIHYWRKLEPINPALPVMAPGDTEQAAAREADETGIIVYPGQLIDSTKAYAKQLEVKPIEVLRVTQQA